MIINLSQNPFQNFKMQDLPQCNHLRFFDDDNEIFEALLHEMNLAFDDASTHNSTIKFIHAYTRISKEMLSRNINPKVMAPLLQDTLKRSVILLHQFRHRTREHFAEKDSIYRFQVDPQLLVDSQDTIDTMVKSGRNQQSYDLKHSPGLREWIQLEIQPLIEEYIGSKIYSPTGELRFADVDKVSSRKHENFKHHLFGNYHFDQNASSEVGT